MTGPGVPGGPGESTPGGTIDVRFLTPTGDEIGAMGGGRTPV